VENCGASGISIEKLSVHMLLFADDIALVAQNAIDLQVKINALKKYFEENNLKINLLKTKAVIFRRQGKVTNDLFWGKQRIEIVDQYTYLGIPFHFSGKFDTLFTTFKNKAT